MNLQMGSQLFENVSVPLLWGERAIIQDQEGRLSIIDLSGPVALLEVLGDEPAPGVEFVPTTDGIEILRDGTPEFSYEPGTRTVTSISLGLPRCQISENEIRIGDSVFSGNMVVGFGVGIAVSKTGIAMGAQVPANLADLVV